jgi:hypothetical protein
MGSIAVAKSMMLYQGIAPEPNQCQACAYAACSSATHAGRFHCGKGSFFVAGVAGCKEWLPKKPEEAA